jgi:hypothetical protein
MRRAIIDRWATNSTLKYKITICIGIVLIAYISSYIVYTSYVAHGTIWVNPMNKDGYHVGINHLMPIPDWVLQFYCPCIWVDVAIGRLSIGVG